MSLGLFAFCLRWLICGLHLVYFFVAVVVLLIFLWSDGELLLSLFVFVVVILALIVSSCLRWLMLMQR